MTILVTGATGLVGNNLVRMLLERGDAVRVLVREGSDPRPLEGLEVELRHGDIRDESAVLRAMDGIEAVLHAAGHVHLGWTGTEMQRAINVDGTRHVAVAALAADAQMVHVSSVDALGIGAKEQPADEESPVQGKVPCGYVLTKRDAEVVLQESIAQGLFAPIVNPGFMLGPWDWKPSSGRMLLAVAKTFTPLAPDGGCSVCDVRDVCRGILTALERGQSGRRYVLAGENLSFFEFWQQLAKRSGGSPPFGRAGKLLPWIAGRMGDLMGKLSGKEGDVNSASVRVSNQFHFYSSARAQQELDYQNRPLEETIRDAWEWFQDHGY